MAKSANYWKERMKALEDEQYVKTTEYYNDLQKQFRMAQNNLQIDIEYWYRRLAENNDISLTAAKKLLNKDELEEFHWTVEEYIKRGEENAVNPRWMRKLENASAKVHINRLEAMKLQVQQHAEIFYQNYEHGTTEFLSGIYEDTYYHTAYEIAKETSISSSFSRIDTNKIDKVIKTPWGQDGKVFSDRIWENKDKLVRELHTELTQCLIRGENPDEAAKRLAEKMGTKLTSARTLVYTESTAISASAQKDCFSELQIEEFEIVETLDSHTCGICGEMDGRHFPMKDFQIGITAPPFHPRCRGCTCPYFDDEFTNGKRIARGEDGKQYYVPENMTYTEWKQSFVDEEPSDAQDKTVDYLIRSHTPGQNVTKERKIVNEAVAAVPPKVQQALANTVIDVGKDGASQYDYVHDILYVAKGAEKEEIIHEIGHMVENKLLDNEKVNQLREKIVGFVYPQDIITETYYDNAGNAIDIFLLSREQFVSQYQGRIYINNIFDAFKTDGTFSDELLWEFMSEPFRQYVENPMLLKEKSPEIFALIEEAVL